jgi:hypothetical protein
MEALEVAVRNDYVEFSELLTLWRTGKTVRPWFVGIYLCWDDNAIRIPSIEFCEKLVHILGTHIQLEVSIQSESHQLAALLASRGYVDEAVYVIQSIRDDSVRKDPRTLADIAMINGEIAFAGTLEKITENPGKFKQELTRGIKISFCSAELYNKTNYWDSLVRSREARFLTVLGAPELPTSVFLFLLSSVRSRSRVAFDYFNSHMTEIVPGNERNPIKFTFFAALRDIKNRDLGRLNVIGSTEPTLMLEIRKLAHQWGYPPACELLDRILAD